MKNKTLKIIISPIMLIVMVIGWCLYYVGGKFRSTPNTHKKPLDTRVLQYKIERYIDLLLPGIFLFFAITWLIQTLIVIAQTGTPYTVVTLLLTPINMHATTSINLTLIYIVSYLFFRTFQLGHQRVVRALLFTVLGVVFYDAIWSISNFIINGSGSFILPIVSTVIILFYIILLHRQKKILDLNWKRLIPIFIIYFIALYIFISSGFFQQWGLYEQGLATDPTGWQWLLNKTVTLWMWVGIQLR